MDEWMKEWIDGWMNEWKNRRMAWVNGWMDSLPFKIYCWNVASASLATETRASNP